MIQRLLQALANARAACLAIKAQAQQVLSQPSGVKWCKWQIAKSLNEAMDKILVYLPES